MLKRRCLSPSGASVYAIPEVTDTDPLVCVKAGRLRCEVSRDFSYLIPSLQDKTLVSIRV